MSLIKVKCQACGEIGKIDTANESDKEFNFFLQSSHTDFSGDTVFALFCFSCGSINAATKDSKDLKYLITFKLEESELYKWCIDKNVNEINIKKMKDLKYL